MTPGSFKGRFAACLLSLCSLVAACSGSDAGTDTGPQLVTPTTIAASATMPSTAQAGSTVSVAPAVTVTGTGGKPAAGVAVTFAVTGGGSIATTSATTDGNGQASAGAWVLGTQTGTNTVVATAAGLSPVTFQVSATAADPSTIVALPDNVTNAVVGQTITPGVRVADRFGNSVPNTTVTFTADAGTVSTATTTTDASGIARVGGWALATTVGTQTLHANAGAMSSTIAVVTSAAAPSQIVRVSGDVQTGVVGALMSTLPAVKVTDAFGNIAVNAAVTYSVTEGNSVLVGSSQTTDASGVATLAGWTLGTTAGRNTVTATLAGGASTAFTVIGTPGALTGLTITAGNTQTAAAGASVSIKPSVRAHDGFGNGVAGVNVTYAVTTGSGSVTGATAITGADGLATLGSWTLGNTPGPNSVTASASGVQPVTFTATAVAGAATQLVKFAGDAQTASAGAAVTIAPSVTVKDAFGNVVAGALVTFAVTSGGGTVTGATRTSDANGHAAVTSWTLGNAGTNTLSASIGGATVSFTATATAAVTNSLSKVSGDNTACTAGFGGCSFVVKVTNSLGAAVAGQTVVWTSGAVTQQTTTNSAGLATSNNIVAQTGAGAFTQTAALPGSNASVTFNYLTAASPPGNFNIDLRFIGSVTQSQLATFSAAAAKWASVISGDVSDLAVMPGQINAGDCGVSHPSLVGNVDDLIIYVELKYLDGFGTPSAGNLLGQAYPCYVRDTNNTPFVGVMQFDTTDLTPMANNGTLQAVITHEMGHVLGIGTMWNLADGGFDLMTGAGGSDPFFKGAAAKDYFTRVGGTVALGNGVPIENCLVGVPTGCGAGTRDSHWRESVFKNELMTGYVDRVSNPLSVVTIASLQDEGYQVNFAAADLFNLSTAVSGNMAMTAEGDPNSINVEGVLLKEGKAPVRPRRLGH